MTILSQIAHDKQKITTLYQFKILSVGYKNIWHVDSDGTWTRHQLTLLVPFHDNERICLFPKLKHCSGQDAHIQDAIYVIYYDKNMKWLYYFVFTTA